MNNSKNKIMLYLCIAVFLILGVYLTFIANNVKNYDSQTKAYNIYPNESYDSESGTTYQPTYYFKVDGRDYECRSKISSSSYPNENKNTVYYDSTDPTKCKTEYEKSTNKIAGIICLVVTVVMIYFFIIKKPSDSIETLNQVNSEEYQIMQEKTDKIIATAAKIQLIYKRVIIGIIIIVLLFFVLIDSALLKQTIKAKDYIETTATYVDIKENEEDSILNEYIYTFKDKQENTQEIIMSYPKDSSIKDEVKIKYNENNPQDYYDEDSTLDRNEFIWYIVKLVALILLTMLFFNKKILNKINISSSMSRERYSNER